LPRMPGLSLRFDGPAVVDHSIDISVLTPALMAVGDLVLQGRTEFYPDAPKINVRLKATQPGSFVAFLDLQNWVDQAISLLNSEGSEALRNLLALLFSGTGLAGAVKWLKGRRPTDAKQLNDDTVVLTTADGDELRVPVKVWQAYESPRIRRALEHLVEPVDNEGIESLEIQADDEDPVSVSSDEVRYFRAPAFDSEIVTDETFTETLTVHTTKSESNRWWFRDQRKELIRADIEDKGFIDRYQKSAPNERIGGNDQLRCRVRLVQREDPLSGQVTSEHFVTEVIEVRHITPPRQGQIPIPPDAPPDAGQPIT